MPIMNAVVLAAALGVAISVVWVWRGVQDRSSTVVLSGLVSLAWSAGFLMLSMYIVRLSVGLTASGWF